MNDFEVYIVLKFLITVWAPKVAKNYLTGAILGPFGKTGVGNRIQTWSSTILLTEQLTPTPPANFLNLMNREMLRYTYLHSKPE